MPSEMTLKIFSYNVQMLDQLHTFKFHNNERGKRIAEVLARSDYDVLIFQEAFDNEARREMLKILLPVFPYRTAVVGNDDDIRGQDVLNASFLVGPAAGAALFGPAGFIFGFLAGPIVGGLFGWITGRPKSDGGVFMMSRWPVEVQAQVIYKRSESEDRLGRKGVSWAMVNKQGFYFNVLGTHTQADAKFEAVRTSQFSQVRQMYEALAPNWQPALIGGDLNVDFCYEADRCPRNVPADGCCSTWERDTMLNTLQASMPGDLSKFTYTRSSSNDLKNPFPDLSRRSYSLDYVLHASEPRQRPLRPQPLRSSLETVRPRGRVDGRTRDLSDHFGVLGTYTFPFVREDSLLFNGTWKCVKYDNKPDTHNHRMTIQPFGRQVLNELDGQRQPAYVYQIRPGRDQNRGKITFKTAPTGGLVEYDYSFNENAEFLNHFVPSEIETPRLRRVRMTRPRKYNELLLRNGQRSLLYAFERWPEVEVGEGIQPGGRV